MPPLYNVVVYERRGTAWSQSLRIPTFDNLWVRPQIDLERNRLAIAARFERGGQAKLVAYDHTALGWTLVASGPRSELPFALAGDRVIHGLQVLELSDARWIEVGELRPPDGALRHLAVPKVAGPLLATVASTRLTEHNYGAVITYALDGRRSTLHASTSILNLAKGGTLVLSLDTGSEHGGALFMLAGSLAGTSPGFDLLGTHVPLVAHDPYFQFSKRLGRLDARGKATVEVVIPAVAPGSALGFLKDRTLHHAFVIHRPKHGILHVSNVARTALVGAKRWR